MENNCIDENTDVNQKEQSNQLKYHQSSFFKGLLFSWLNPLIEKKDSKSIDFSFPPELAPEYQYAHHSKRLKFFYDKLISEKQNKHFSEFDKKVFFIKLICSAFKWDVILILMLVIMEKTTIYAISFAFQKVLEIPTNSSKEEFLIKFSIYSFLIIFLKTTYSFLTENVGFYIVK